MKLIDILKEVLAEAKFEDISVVPSKGTQRGTSEEGARSFDINIGNVGVINKMSKTPMGYKGKMRSFSHEGPNTGDFKEFEWEADTPQWEVWKNMNYIALTPSHHTHWYHGKIPGGPFKDAEGNIGKELPDLSVSRFGSKVYKALLLEPSVGYILSDKKSSTDLVRRSVYQYLMNDPDFVWIATNGDTYNTYDNIIVINPKHANVEKEKQKFENDHKGAKFYTSSNLTKNK
jgi:hypothetical protein